MTVQRLATLGVAAVDLATYAGGRYAVIQRDPEPGDAEIPRGTGIHLRIADLEGDPYGAGGGGWGHAPWGHSPWGHAPPSALECTVAVDGLIILTYTGGVATWDPAWTGTVTPGPITAPYVYADVDAAPVAPPAFASEQVVAVRVVVFPGIPPALDVTYTFTIEDVTPPTLVAVAARSPAVVRVTYDEPMAVAGPGSALDPAAYTLTARNVPPLPGVAVTAVAAAAVPGSNNCSVDLDLNWEMTPGCNYDLEVAATVTDAAGNAIT